MATVVASMTNWVVGAKRPTPTITWYQNDGTVQDLTGVSSITGIMRNQSSGKVRAIAGTLAVSDAAAGQFTWTLHTSDVAEAGVFDVQFTAVYSSGQSPAKTYTTTWTIVEAYSA